MALAGFGLVGIQRLRLTVAHIAEGATAGTYIPHDHKCSRAAAKTFTQVGAVGLFAQWTDGFAQQLFNAIHFGEAGMRMRIQSGLRKGHPMQSP